MREPNLFHTGVSENTETALHMELARVTRSCVVLAQSNKLEVSKASKKAHI